MYTRDTLEHQPRGRQYLTHAHSHINRAVADPDSCFVLVRTHQHGIAASSERTRKLYVFLAFITQGSGYSNTKRGRFVIKSQKLEISYVVKCGL